ncbi:MAG: CapA family protein [Clostridia bacterium]|nr:CapA family protein [Clostridia bacterium]
MKNDLLIFGDICPDNDYKPLFSTAGTGVFDSGVKDLIEQAAYVVGNLECPATNEVNAITKCGPSLKAEPKDIQYLKAVGFDAFSLANNHILDYGAQAVRETIACCKEYQLDYFGAGENVEQAKKALRTEVCGKQVGIISFAEAEFNLAGEDKPGANHFDVYDSLEDIRKLKATCDYVAVLYHGGIEHYIYPSPLLQKKCRAMVQAGADLVLCQHSHCIGTMETAEEGTIVYGQGNSAFGYREGNSAWNEGFIVGVDLETKALSFYLMNAQKQGIVLAKENAHKKRIERFEEDSANLDNAQFIQTEWKKYCMQQEALDLPMLFGRSRVFNKANRLLNNALIKLFYAGKKQMITMNLIRCEAHHEVVTTILKNNVFENK